DVETTAVSADGLSLVCFLFSSPVILDPPAQVEFKSVDYVNILHWTTANYSHNNSHNNNNNSLKYYVQWKIYGEAHWLDVDSCQGIYTHHCDLTEVTAESREWYYARVHAASPPSSKSAWTMSRRFSPRWDTRISSPVLRVNVTDQGMTVHVRPSQHLVHKIHKNLFYKIFLKHNSGEEELFEMSCCSKKLVLKNLEHRTKYCLQAQTVVPPFMSSSRSSLECDITL
uniref:Interleukin 22 receptor, alpha 2 n=1 Tax=Cynoglossus semilaevis TaxID=244447 RepID=A0A3P8URB5_CYNSE